MAINVDTHEYYIYTISPVGGRAVSGIIFCENLSSNENFEIVEHELTSKDKVMAIGEAILNEGIQKSPIVLGYYNNFELDNIIKLAPKTLICCYEYNKAEHSIFSVRKDWCEQLQKILSKKNTFYVLDGHHRYNALQKTTIELNGMMVWVVPINMMQVKTYLRCVAVKDFNKFNQQILLNQQTYSYISRGYNFTVYYNKQFYKLKTEFCESTFETIDKLLNMLAINNVISNISYYPYSTMTDIIDIIRNNQIQLDALIIPQNISFTTIKNAFTTKQVLPIHSTCFCPKPLEGLFNYYVVNGSCLIN